MDDRPGEPVVRRQAGRRAREASATVAKRRETRGGRVIVGALAHVDVDADPGSLGEVGRRLERLVASR